MFTKKWAEIIAKRLSMEVDDTNILSDLDNTKGYCPCIPKWVRSREHLCPCKEARYTRICRCGLFK